MLARYKLETDGAAQLSDDLSKLRSKYDAATGSARLYRRSEFGGWKLIGWK